MKSELPYPPKTITSDPIKKTAAAVNKRPVLKQTPVADARMPGENSNGIYMDKIPWLAPKNKAKTAVSA